jgi:transketolase
MRNTSLNAVYDLAKESERVVFIGSDLGPGVLDSLKKDYPSRFFMEGVSEQHIIGMAAGLAMDGFIPYINTIATFLTRRCYEQVTLDLGLHNLPVRLIASGGGVVYAPLGPTHLAIEDIALMRSIPNMTVIAPCDAEEMKRLMPQTLSWPNPIYIRLGKGGDEVVSDPKHGFTIGKAILLKEPKHGLFITTGITTQIALQAAKMLEYDDFQAGVLHMHTIKPLDEAALAQWLPEVPTIVTVEEHLRHGGLGSAVLEFANDFLPEYSSRIRRIGFSDKFPEQYGTQNSLMGHLGITKEILVESMKNKRAFKRLPSQE